MTIINKLYFPNLYRVDEYRKNEIDTKIPYHQSNMEGEVYKAFQVGITYRLLEQLLFYDRVYIDLIELPIFLNVLSWIDSSSMKVIIKKGLISYVNCYDMNLGVTYTHSKYFGGLAIGKGKNKLISTSDQLRDFVFERFNYNKDIDSVISDLFNNSIDFPEDDLRDVVKQVDRDLKDKDIRGRLRLKSTSGVKIIKKEVPIINALSYASRDLFVAEKLRIKNLYTEDIILDVMEARYEKRFSNEAFKFNQLIKNYQIPDIELLLFFKKMNVEDLLAVRESKNFCFLKNNVLEVADIDSEILQVFMTVTNNRLSKNDITYKLLSMITSTLFGLIDPLSGIAISTVSEIISTIKSNKGHPTVALEKLSKLLDEKSIDYKGLPNIVTTKVQKHYMIK